MKCTLLAIIAMMAVGCSKPADVADTPTPTPDAANSPRGMDEGGVTPMTTTPGGIAPVAGTDSVAGGGSNQGQMMKDRAKAVGQPPPPPVPSPDMPADQ